MTTSIGSILSTARTAMSANQAAIGVVSHNVANAATPGYSRQRAELVAAMPLVSADGIFGRGVELADVSRLRDSMLDVTYRNETSGTSFWQRRGSLLGQVESLYGDLSSPGLSTSLDSFYRAWSDLANDPSNTNLRTLVRQAGDDVADQMHRLSNGLDQISASAAQRLTYDVSEVNRLSSQVATLNRQIVGAEAGGYTAGDLRDARDLAVDQIASYAAIQVVERSDGSYGVSINGINIVDGTAAPGLVVDSTGGVYSLKSSSGTVVRSPGGALGATMGAINTDIPAARAELDLIARELANGVNGIHQTGMNAAGQTNVLFFDDFGNPASITARNLTLSAAVQADPAAISAGTPATDPISGLPVYGAGRNDVALSLAQLRDALNPALGNTTISGAFGIATGRIGTDVRTAQDNSSIHATLAGQADTSRSSVSGVNIDEEMVHLIRFQNAYAAAARLVTTADEMLRTVIEMKR